MARIAVTGAHGFIGRNLCLQLSERPGFTVLPIVRDTSADDRRAALASADVVFHLAGVNRPVHPDEFHTGNAGFTEVLCSELGEIGRPTPLLYVSSSQAARDTPYGRSKRTAETHVERYGEQAQAPIAILRLVNVFGKWARPNYNSVVATFCHNTARGLPIQVHDPEAELMLLHVDDVVTAMFNWCAPPSDASSRPSGLLDVGPVHPTTVGELADVLQRFADSRTTLTPGAVGHGFTRALYSTYLSYLPPEAFAYSLVRHDDARGTFAEMLRTETAGQFSFFTAGPGVTRGGHYHHTKNEKFLVVQGTAQFGFRHVITGEQHSLTVHASESRVVETVPGWAHNITNVGETDVIVLLWANEIFDPERPDTFAAQVQP